jgi:hypothetical protein
MKKIITTKIVMVFLFSLMLTSAFAVEGGEAESKVGVGIPDSGIGSPVTPGEVQGIVAEQKIKKLEAEVLRLTTQLAETEKMANQKIAALEDLVAYLNQVLQNVRSQVGNTEPAPNAR